MTIKFRCQSTVTGQSVPVSPKVAAYDVYLSATATKPVIFFVSAYRLIISRIRYHLEKGNSGTAVYGSSVSQKAPSISFATTFWAGGGNFPSFSHIG